MSVSPSAEWYALFVRSQNELSISRFIEKHIELPTLVPLQKVWKQVRSKTTIFEKPIFRSYVFVCGDVKSRAMRSLYGVNGVFDFVRAGSHPASIPFATAPKWATRYASQ